MFLRLKIYGTIFAIYEIFAVLFLHSKTACNSVFTAGFCMDSVEKYFTFCVAVPAVVFLVFMWVGEIRKYIRRRHSLFYRAKNVVEDVATEIKDKVSEKISPQYLERILAALLLLGAKKYADKNPKAREILKEIIGFDIVGEEEAERVEDSNKKSSSKKRTNKK